MLSPRTAWAVARFRFSGVPAAHPRRDRFVVDQPPVRRPDTVERDRSRCARADPFDGRQQRQRRQKTPERFAAQKVTVIGTLDPKTMTIQVESIAAVP